MDSRLLAGAYSMQFKAFEQQTIEEDNRLDSLAKAKKLSQETNKRRKVQAHRRKIEAQREEKRRQEILLKRREEQKLATEKYQRSHLPPSARQGSGRRSPRRQGFVLDDALRLIRGGPDRPGSSKNENEDPMERSYFNSTWHHPVLAPPSKSQPRADANYKTELLDSSMQNYSSSRSLFEQQLDNQQNLLREQQQSSLREFNEAIKKEIEDDETVQGIIEDPYEDSQLIDNDSCSSVDSLEKSMAKNTSSRPASAHPKLQSSQMECKQEETQSKKQFYFHPPSLSQGSNTYRVSHDLTESALFDKQGSMKDLPPSGEIEQLHKQQSEYSSFKGKNSSELLHNTISQQREAADQPSAGKLISVEPSQLGVSQTSSFLLRTLQQQSNTRTKPFQTQGEEELWKQQNKTYNNLMVSEEKSPTFKQNVPDRNTKGQLSQGVGEDRNRNETENLQPRYASAISTSIWAGQITPSQAQNANYSNKSTTLTLPVPSTTQQPAVNTASLTAQSTATQQVISTSTNPASAGSQKPVASPPPSGLNTPSMFDDFAAFNKQILTYSKAYSQQDQNDTQKVPQSKAAPATDTPNVSNNQTRLENNFTHPTEEREDLLKAHMASLLVSGRSTNNINSSKFTATPASTSNYNVKTTDDTQGFYIEKVHIKEESSEDNTEDLRPVRGILKQTNLNTEHNKSVHAKPHVRDSLELARLHNERKTTKKSVRFADHNIEENDIEIDEEDDEMFVPKNIEFTNRPGPNRPASAKNFSTPKPEAVRATRTASAGTIRPTQEDSAQLQIRNVQQLYQNTNTSNTNTSNTNTSNTTESQAANSGGLNQRSNLPYTNPVNTSGVINRPRAAAHIIMNSESQNHIKGVTTDQDNNQTTSSHATTAHKSQLEAKVKSINNNFMTKVPVRVPASSQGVVYHAAFDNDELTGLNTTNSNTTEPNYQVIRDEERPLNNDRSRIRDTASRRVAISNATVTRTSIVPASTKISYPQTNTAIPAYSTTSGKNQPVAVYGENGLRIDRTPTDEEITWLWDKVRSCLHKEDSGGNKPLGGPSGDPGSRPPPYLSTKLIDGTSLGFSSNVNTNNNVDAAGSRGGSGFVQTHVAAPVAVTQNKVKSVIQPQGSYLKRYGLLKQRRTHSASPAGTTGAQANQRASSAVYGHQPTIHALQPAVSYGQPQQKDAHVTLAYTYKPQDEVSESTAAFVMAERLAKQSLSDSHIQLAMEDAQSKQELHNRSKIMAARGGHSALSVEEQRLLESLDRLNERLKDTNKTNGTIHFHQPFQPHLTGFRGHTPVIDSRRHNLTSPRVQQRAQSARIRQQTRQYR
ncbi:transcription initiation factor TFIID subunit 1-like [Physella acuta]|uniref:transcription initiation factor TFIID subunit 1-like n=1 Tax=Physella acuta TaxID=109671 RepID=UPI0027DB03D4|nr:transcription initiation factor TFIID subunit 1-like [Physella acuta]